MAYNSQLNRPRYTPGALSRRRRRKAKAAFWLLIIATAIVIGADAMNACNKNRDREPLDIEGDLTAVTTNPAMAEQIIRYKGMTVSFNPDEHVANWVAYELTADEARGEEPRYNNFSPDYDVEGCASPADYRNTGFDRGHLAPAADMKWDPEAMRQSFLMTNIAPQVHSLNRGPWQKLEEKCRAKAIADSAVIIVCGPVLTDSVDMRIGSTGVAVPRRYFKVILSPYAEQPSAIGFIMPNETFSGGMQACAVSVDSVEAVTGHDFFPALPDDIETTLESKTNFNQWSHIRK